MAIKAPQHRESLKLASRDSLELLHCLTTKHSTDSSQSAINWGELTDSPINPFWVNNAKSILIMTLHKKACFFGKWHGQGFIINRLPATHPGLVRFSAPCFIKSTGWSVGLSFGSQKRSTFALCMSSAAEKALLGKGGVTTTGIELACAFGTNYHCERADVIAAATSGSLGTVGNSNGSGTMIDLSYARVQMEVDHAKNKEAYGGDVDINPYDLLHGQVPPPKELAPLYGQLSSIVVFEQADEEKVVSAPSRVSASLERLTTGRDPEKDIVMGNGRVVS